MVAIKRRAYAVALPFLDHIASEFASHVVLSLEATRYQWSCSPRIWRCCATYIRTSKGIRQHSWHETNVHEGDECRSRCPSEVSPPVLVHVYTHKSTLHSTRYVRSSLFVHGLGHSTGRAMQYAVGGSSERVFLQASFSIAGSNRRAVNVSHCSKRLEMCTHATALPS